MPLAAPIICVHQRCLQQRTGAIIPKTTVQGATSCPIPAGMMALVKALLSVERWYGQTWLLITRTGKHEHKRDEPIKMFSDS